MLSPLRLNFSSLYIHILRLGQFTTVFTKEFFLGGGLKIYLWMKNNFWLLLPLPLTFVHFFEEICVFVQITLILTMKKKMEGGVYFFFAWIEIKFWLFLHVRLNFSSFYIDNLRLSQFKPLSTVEKFFWGGGFLRWKSRFNY